MPNEVWKDIVGYEGLYQVSDMGRVMSLYVYRGTNSRLKTIGVDDQGYLFTSLNRHKKTKVVRVHRIVLQAFVGPCLPGYQGCHIDGNRRNPRLTNLRWGTSQDNSSDAIRHGTMPRGEKCGRSRLTVDQVVEIKLLRRQGISQYVLAERFGVHQATISLIDTGKTWHHI